MKARIFILLLSFVTSSLIQSQTTIDASIKHGGLTRTYRLYIPAKYNPANAVPLLFNLHGYGSNNFQQEFYGDFRPIADTANFIIALPNGSLDNANKQYWNSLGTVSTVDDVGFISALIDTISSKYNIDKNAVYSTGMSNGGFQSYKLACELSNKITAIASVAGTMTYMNLNLCNPGRPVPVMHIHGTNDGTVPYIGSLIWLPVEDLVQVWVDHNKCNKIPVVTDVPDINMTDNCTAVHYVYENGEKGSTVEFYKVVNGDHSWPGAKLNLNTTNQDFNASLEIWRFFRKYKLNALTNTKEIDESNKLAFTLYPNPTVDKFRIVFKDTKERDISVVNETGQTIYNIRSTQIEEEIKLDLPGIYLVKVKQDNLTTTQKLIKNK